MMSLMDAFAAALALILLPVMAYVVVAAVMYLGYIALRIMAAAVERLREEWLQ